MAETISEEEAFPGHLIPIFLRRLSMVVGFLLHLPEVSNLNQSYWSKLSVMFDLPLFQRQLPQLQVTASVTAAG